MVFKIDDSMEAIIQRKVQIIQEFIKPNPECSGNGINPVMKKHFEMEIDILKNAPRDAAKLERIIEEKESRRKYDTSLNIVDLHNLVSEIEILKFVFYLVDRDSHNNTAASSILESSNKSRYLIFPRMDT